MKSIFVLSAEALELAFGEPLIAVVRRESQLLAVITPGEAWADHREALAEAEVIFTGWGAPLMDDAFLHATPRVRAVFHAGGSIRPFVTDGLWSRGIRVFSAHAVNAVPVAEYAASALLLGLKRVWHYAALTRQLRSFPEPLALPGAYRSRVGLVSFGEIARRVCRRLRESDLEIVVYDPFVSPFEASQAGIRLVSLAELFATCDAVSVHTPLLPATEGLVSRSLLESLKPGAFFLNTSRGRVIDELALVDVLSRRPDLQAMLDVTEPQPPLPDSPLYRLPNVVLTPHLAGSIGAECRRMGEAMLAAYRSYRAGGPSSHEIPPERFALLA